LGFKRIFEQLTLSGSTDYGLTGQKDFDQLKIYKNKKRTYEKTIFNI